MKSELQRRGSKESPVEEILERLADALEDASEKLDAAEHALHNASTGRGADKKPSPYVNIMNFAYILDWKTTVFY